MGVEVSADGSHMFFSLAAWELNGFKIGTVIESDIFFLKKPAFFDVLVQSTELYFQMVLKVHLSIHPNFI